MKFSWNDIDNDTLKLRLAIIVIAFMTTNRVCVRAANSELMNQYGAKALF
jgi:hypothetical protein